MEQVQECLKENGFEEYRDRYSLEESTLEEIVEGDRKDYPNIFIKDDCRTPERVVIAAERTVLFSVESVESSKRL